MRVTIPDVTAPGTHGSNSPITVDSDGVAIVYAPLVRVTHLHGVLWMYSAAAFVFLVVVLISGGSAAPLFAGLAAFVMLVFVALAYKLQRFVSSQPRLEYGPLGTPLRENASAAHAVGWATFNFARPSLLWNWHFDRGERWNPIEEALHAAGVEVPATVAEESVRDALEAIPIIEDLIEPEFIVASRPMGRAATGMLLIAVMFFVFQGISRRNWPAIAINVVFALTLLMSLPKVRNRFPVLRNEGRAPLAAPGIVRDTKGRRWVRGQALMVVQRTRSAGPIWVTLLGPEGLLRWSFSSAKDEDFINLWQRWNHPHPRPELLTE